MLSSTTPLHCKYEKSISADCSRRPGHEWHINEWWLLSILCGTKVTWDPTGKRDDKYFRQFSAHFFTFSYCEEFHTLFWFRSCICNFQHTKNNTEKPLVGQLLPRSLQECRTIAVGPRDLSRGCQSYLLRSQKTGIRNEWKDAITIRGWRIIIEQNNNTFLSLQCSRLNSLPAVSSEVCMY